MQENNNVLRILKETLAAFIRKDAEKVKQLSDQTINTASRSQDADNIAVAVIVYSLGKVLERERYSNYPGYKKFYSVVLDSLKRGIQDIENNNLDNFRTNLEAIRREIGKLSGKLRKYIKEVFRKSEVKKASRIYEHGISLERTAKLLGVTMYELAEYSGQTGISDVKESRTKSATERIKMAMELFR